MQAKALARVDSPAAFRRCDGYTLIEVIVACAVLAIVLVCLAPFFYTSRALMIRAALMRDAVNQASSFLDEQRQNHFLAPGTTTQSIELNQRVPATRTLEVASVAEGSYPAARYRLVVTVQWPYRDRTEQVTLSTQILNWEAF